MIVVGDYYLIGETDDSMGVNRLIREYSVNSKNDLDHYVQEHPEIADRYMDVGLAVFAHFDRLRAARRHGGAGAGESAHHASARCPTLNRAA